MAVQRLHRLVGILVLAAVGTILLPIFSGKMSQVNQKKETAVVQQTAAFLPMRVLPLRVAPPVSAAKKVNLSSNPSAVVHATKPEAPKKSMISMAALAPAISAVAPPAIVSVVVDSFDLPVEKEKSTEKIKENEVVKNKVPVVTAIPVEQVDPSVLNVPANYAIQVGHFRQHTHAERLMKKLQAAGYAAFIRTLVLKNGEIRERVYVGAANLSEEKLHQLAHDLNQQLHLAGLVVRLPYNAERSVIK